MIRASPDLDALVRAEEPRYRSLGEARLGKLFDYLGIDFFYEQPLIVHDRGAHRIWHPDFTLPGYGGLVVEYAGMPGDPEYMQGVRHKQAAYERNEVPAAFIYPWDLHEQGRVLAKLHEAAGPECGVMEYPATSEASPGGPPHPPTYGWHADRR